MFIIFIGPPGSGKGTQSYFLSKALSIPHLSVGDMLRQVSSGSGDDSSTLREFMQRGMLVPAKLVNDLTAKALLTDKYKDGCVLDGYPRSLEQALFLENIINTDIVVICFTVSKSIIMQRILGRFNCVNCGKIYNSYYNNPKKHSVCDDCQSTEFMHRKDDNEDTVVQRIVEYEVQTQPLIDYYKRNNKLFYVDASKTPSEVSNTLIDLLKTI